MANFFRSLAVALLFVGSLQAQQVQNFKFNTSSGHIVDLVVNSLPPYEGQQLSFYKEAKNLFCGSRNIQCYKEFVGSLALVNITVTLKGKPAQVLLKEKCTQEEYSSQLPRKEPFEVAVPLVKGKATDVQLMGVFQDGLSPNEWQQQKDVLKGAAELVRQELFISGESTPFAILTWRRSDTSAQVVNVETPQSFMASR